MCGNFCFLTTEKSIGPKKKKKTTGKSPTELEPHSPLYLAWNNATKLVHSTVLIPQLCSPAATGGLVASFHLAQRQWFIEILVGLRVTGSPTLDIRIAGWSSYGSNWKFCSGCGTLMVMLRGVTSAGHFPTLFTYHKRAIVYQDLTSLTLFTQNHVLETVLLNVAFP